MNSHELSRETRDHGEWREWREREGTVLQGQSSHPPQGVIYPFSLLLVSFPPSSHVVIHEMWLNREIICPHSIGSSLPLSLSPSSTHTQRCLSCTKWFISSYPPMASSPIGYLLRVSPFIFSLLSISSLVSSPSKDLHFHFSPFLQLEVTQDGFSVLLKHFSPLLITQSERRECENPRLFWRLSLSFPSFHAVFAVTLECGDRKFAQERDLSLKSSTIG